MAELDDQPIAERRRLRSKYRSLLSDAATRKNEYLSGSTALLLEDLERSNALYDAVSNPAEGVLDSKFLLISADIGAQRAHQMRLDSAAFDSLTTSTGCARRCTAHPTPTSSRWRGSGPTGRPRQAPRFSCIYGPLMAEAKERRPRVKRQPAKPPAASTQQSASIETMGESDVKKQENQTTRLVQKIHKILAQVGPINLFELVINPRSFAQSVENIFYVSFLIRDGKAFIDDESGQPMIEACEPPQQDDYLSGLTKKQLIFSLDVGTWREIIDAYAIADSVIPQRVSERNDQGLSQIASQVLR
ncbi:Nse4 C-terminal-domain-containing protein [Coemansia spiralis]|nr:Nse4 C-terminal-domain-containing protein [Coemansia spiralis]